MIKFDLETNTKNFYKEEDLQKLLGRKEEILEKLEKADMTGWMRPINKDIVNTIKTTAHEIKEKYNCLVVIGIEGSYLGSYAFSKIFQKYFNDNSFEIIYAGTTLSSNYLSDLEKYLQNRNFCVNVISKSGNTLETLITYNFLKKVITNKYGEEELKNRIIITTNDKDGSLREEALIKKLKTLSFPDDIGGRFSFLTPAHLLPLALNYNIDEIIEGYYEGKKLTDIAYEYAAIRNLLYNEGKVVENFAVYEENMQPFTEWLKQLFGETEGKNKKGILPMSTINTRDLHSLGQFIQDGNNIIFETFIKTTNYKEFIEYKGRGIHDINNLIEDSVIKAHSIGNVPSFLIELTELDIESISTLIYFFMLAASFSAYMFDLNPFDQPGVEVYKKEVKNALNN